MLIFFKDSNFVTAVSSIPDETALLTSLDLILNRKPITATTGVDVLASLSNTPTTILTQEANFETAMNLVLKFSHTIGPINIIFCTDQALEKFGLQKAPYALHRSLDEQLVQFDGTESSFLKESRCIFGLATESRLRQVKDDCILLYTPVLMAPHRSLIIQLSEFFKDLPFFYLPGGSLARQLEEFTHQTIEDSSFSIVFMNPQKKMFYNITAAGYKHGDYRTPFNPQHWADVLSMIIGKYSAGLLKQFYQSEKETSENDKSKTIYKIVTSDYEKFTSQPDQDSVVLYISTRNKKCINYFSKYVNFAKDLASRKKLKFTYLDVENNGRKGGYPVETLPQILLFPANDKKNPKVLYGQPTTNELKWFMFLYGNLSYGAFPELPDKETFKANQEKMENETKQWKDKKLVGAMHDYYQKIQNYIDNPEMFENDLAVKKEEYEKWKQDKKERKRQKAQKRRAEAEAKKAAEASNNTTINETIISEAVPVVSSEL